MFRHKYCGHRPTPRSCWQKCRDSGPNLAESVHLLRHVTCSCSRSSTCVGSSNWSVSTSATCRSSVWLAECVCACVRVCVCIGSWETAMTSRSPVGALRYVVALLMFVVFDSLQTDIKQREYQLIPCIFIIHLRQAGNVDDADRLLLLRMRCFSFFLFHFPAKIRARFSSEETSDRIETLT